jgi:hypothetical protein
LAKIILSIAIENKLLEEKFILELQKFIFSKVYQDYFYQNL